MNRISLLAIALSLLLGSPSVRRVHAAGDDLGEIRTEVGKRHDEAVKRLQDWIKLPSIAAENLNSAEGAEYMAKLAKDAGFQQATVVQTEGKPGVFATLDAGAPKTVGLYFMYDVKQFDPAEWSSSPTDAQIVDKAPLGKAIVGRGAVNQKGPEAAFLAALHAMGFAHCDLKPNNILTNADGDVKIIDFGQACRIGSVKERIQGTPDFIALEQVEKRPVTVRTDVYNFGATLYWALSGHKIPTMFTVKKAKRDFMRDEHVKPPIVRNPGVPQALSDLVMECIRLDPTERPRSMDVVVKGLEGIK